MNRLFPMALCLVAALTACSSTATTSDGIRTVVVLSADQAVRIVVPAGFGESTVAVAAAPETSDVPTTTAIVSTAETTASETTVGTAAGDGADEIRADEGGADESETQEAADEPASTDETATTTTSSTTTTSVAPVKDTIPLAEEDVNPGLKLMGALEDFNACLATEGYSWIGFPNADQGANDPVNQPGYLEALQLCNSRTGISNAYQDFQTSRTDLAPDEMRQENEDFIDLADCLRTKGWDIGELRPDENGLLSPGDRFSSADGDIDTAEIRECISEIALERDGEE